MTPFTTPSQKILECSIPYYASVQMHPSSHQLSDHSLIQWQYTVTNQGTRCLTKKYHCEINVLHPLVP